MFSGRLYEKVDKIFGARNLDLFRWHEVLNEQGEKVGVFNISYYWIVEIHFQAFRLTSAEPITMSIMKTSIGHKGVLLIPPAYRPLGEDVADKPSMAINLDNWNDTVFQSLQSINLMPEDEHSALYNLGGYTFNIEFRTQITSGNLSLESNAQQTESLKTLWRALLKTLYHLVNLYNDDDMREATNWELLAKAFKDEK